MPLGSVWARNAALDACYGSSRAAAWPATVRVRLFDDDPRAAGAELPATGGYAAVTVNNTDAVFPPASGGIKSSVPIDFGSSTGAWGQVARWAVLEHPTNGNRLDMVELNEDVNVTAAGFGVKVTIDITHDEETV
jgi:hypothetical protein